MSPAERDRQADTHSRAAEAQAFTEATLASARRLRLTAPDAATKAELKLLISMAEQAVQAVHELRDLMAEGGDQ